MWACSLSGGRRAQASSTQVEQLRTRETVCPPQDLLLRVFWETPWKNVRVLLLGQAPWFRTGAGTGVFCAGMRACTAITVYFSSGSAPIYSDAATVVLSLDLPRWGRQGVLLLNSILRVAADKLSSLPRSGSRN